MYVKKAIYYGKLKIMQFVSKSQLNLSLIQIRYFFSLTWKMCKNGIVINLRVALNSQKTSISNILVLVGKIWWLHLSMALAPKEKGLKY